ncbi:MAG: Nudix family hydrolase [Burkholderiaceae bacterium]
MNGRTPVDVAVGVLVRPDRSFLLASRPEGKPYAGYWEFPGGKIEPGESIAAALARELHEELGIEIGAAYPWVTRLFDYPHARVRLHFCRVFEWRGEAHAREGQRFGFFTTARLPDGPLLPATQPVMRWIDLPAVYALSNAAPLGVDAFLARLERALLRGVRLVQLREPALDALHVRRLLEEVLARARAHRARVLVSSRHDMALWERADGVHLTAAQLMQLGRRPGLPLVAASTHTRAQIDRAAALDLDFVVAGPVQPTASHPGQSGLGWTAFAEMIRDPALPVYAIGGLREQLLPAAIGRGAHGVALLSAAW